MKQGQKQNDSYSAARSSRNQEQIINRTLWAVVFPGALYFAVCQIVSLLLMLLPVAERIDAVKRQGLGSLVSLVVLYVCFVRRDLRREQKKMFTAPVSGRLFLGMAAAVLLLGCAGIAMNNLLALTVLKQISGGYQAVEQAFYSSSLGWELLSLGVITPVAEEVLYRYLIFYGLRDWRGRVMAVIGSALIFGLVHMNIVQIIYAFVLGLALGVLMEYYQDVRVTICGHIAANFISLLRGETGFLAWLRPGGAGFLPVTLGLFAVAALLTGWHVHLIRRSLA